MALGSFKRNLCHKWVSQSTLHCRSLMNFFELLLLTSDQKVLRETLFQAYDGKPLSYPLEHTAHCLNVLRDDVMCNSDDTPRYTGRFNAEKGKEHPTSGVGQVRMCNDWNKLRAWANEHSGCYKPINKSNPDFPTIERYKFCPDGKVLWDQ
jgi:hypothetical protein